MNALLSTRKPLFWIIATLFSAAGIWFAIKNYSVAFPIAQVDITFSRSQAVAEAKKICEKLHLGPQGERVAAEFVTDDATQLYIELEAGGSTAFNQMVTGTLYSPYTWHVRHFVEGSPHEVKVILKPNGAHYGFIEKISEQMPGPALSVEAARALAGRAAKEWNIIITEAETGDVPSPKPLPSPSSMEGLSPLRTPLEPSKSLKPAIVPVGSSKLSNNKDGTKNTSHSSTDKLSRLRNPLEPSKSLNPVGSSKTSDNGDSALVQGGYHLVESSKEQKPNGRLDHTFTYELPEKIGEGRYRYQIVVSGDKVTSVKPSVKVPESFYKHYSALRSGNLTLRQIAIVLVLLLYILLGCYGGLFYLLRRGEVIWKQPIFWALLIAGLQVIDGVNELPLAWMKYDTATSVNNFLFLQFIKIFSCFVETFLVTLLVSIIVAEGFTRLAFGNKVQLWRSWSKDVAASPTILGQTVGGYLLVGSEIGFSMVLFYIVARNYFGWWVPSQTLANPNVLALYVPWLHPIAQSLHAGFWEECLFRAVPLGGAALIGERFGRRNLFIIIAMIVQTLIFGAGHAHYPAEPAYARVVELIIPSLLFGLLYLLYGLLPIIIAHFTYDVALIALPIFITHAHGSWLDKAMVVLITLIPLCIVLYRRIQQGRWANVPADAYNKAYKPTQHEQTKTTFIVPTHSKLLSHFGSKTILVAAVVCFIGAVAGWALLTRFSHDETPLRITRSQAIELAKQELVKHNVNLSDWQVFSTVHTEPEKEDRYVWQEFTRPLYRELMRDFYLLPPSWEVRFATWQGKLADRAEEYRVYIARDGQVVRYEHKLPQHKPGKSLNGHEAKELAYKALAADGFTVADLKEMGAQAEKQPERTDWKLTFELRQDKLSLPNSGSETLSRLENPSHPSTGSGRTGLSQIENEANNQLKNEAAETLTIPHLRVEVKVSGDEVTNIKRHVFVPEQWARRDKDTQQLLKSIKALVTLAGYVLIGLAALYAFITFQWTGSALLMLCLIFLTIGLFNLFNVYDAVAFKLETSQSIAAQLFRTFSLLTVFSVLLVAIQAFVAAWFISVTNRKKIQSVPVSTALGALCAMILAGMDRISNCCVPAWAHYVTAVLVFPLLGTAAYMIDLFISILLRLAAWGLVCNCIWRFTSEHKRTAWGTCIITLLTIMTAMITAAPALEHDLQGWVIGTIGFTIILTCGYYLLYRYDLRLLVPTAAAFVIISQLKQLVLHAFPGAWIGSAAGIIMVGVMAVGIVYLLQKRE